MSAASFVGIDIGTQSVRVLVVGADGAVLGAGRAPLASRRDGSRHEQSPDEWWSAVCAACRQALAHTDARPAGVAVCATSGTVLLVDSAGTPLSPGLMYDDARASEQAERLTEAGADTWRRNGYHRMQAVWGAPKTLWLQEEVSADGWPVTQADFVNRRLAGAPTASDVSNSLKSGCDPETLRWPTEVFEAVGQRSDRLPELVVPGAPLASVGAAAARETGLPAGVPIHAGMTDGCAAQIASGAVRPGSWNSVLGTTLAIKGTTTDRISDPAGIVYCHRSPEAGWLPGGASGSGAGALTERLPGAPHAELTREAAARAPSSLLAYPLASRRGERFPFIAPDAVGFVLGDPVDDVDLYASLLQGTALMERLCFDYLHHLGADVSGELHLTGGAVNNGYWNQLRCDATHRPVVVPRVTEAAMGMAILVAADVTGAGLEAAARSMVRTEREYLPKPADWVLPAYDRLLGELSARGWLPDDLAAHARRRAE